MRGMDQLQALPIWSISIVILFQADHKLMRFSSLDARQRQIGNANMENVQQLLSTFAIFPFSRRLGMTIDQVNALVSRARIEAVKPSLKAYFRL